MLIDRLLKNIMDLSNVYIVALPYGDAVKYPHDFDIIIFVLLCIGTARYYCHYGDQNVNFK